MNNVGSSEENIFKRFFSSEVPQFLTMLYFLNLDNFSPPRYPIFFMVLVVTIVGKTFGRRSTDLQFYRKFINLHFK